MIGEKIFINVSFIARIVFDAITLNNSNIKTERIKDIHLTFRSECLK